MGVLLGSPLLKLVIFLGSSYRGDPEFKIPSGGEGGYGEVVPVARVSKRVSQENSLD